MLKVTYLESEVYLEALQENLEDWITLRVMLALRAGQRLVVEHITASLLLPVDRVQLSRLTLLARYEDGMTLSRVDAEDWEISLQGCWISSGEPEAEGVFVVSLNPILEATLLKLWQRCQMDTASIRRSR